MRTRSKHSSPETMSAMQPSAGTGSTSSAATSQPASQAAHSGGMGVTMTKTGGVVTTNVRCPVTLDREGVEFPYWDLAFVAACGLKRCQAALSMPMPDTEENAAALLMLIESVPRAWGAKLASMKVAAAAYEWVRNRFTGGANLEVTARWLELLQKGMSDTETLEDYFNRMVALYEALRGNGHLMLERDFKLAVIKGLPEAAKEAGMVSAAAGRDLEGLWEIIVTTAKGLGFDDQVPRVTPVARAAIHTAPTISSSNNQLEKHTAGHGTGQAAGQGTGQGAYYCQEGSERRDNRRCHYCNKPGHFKRDCPRKKTDEELHQNVKQVMAAMANLLPRTENPATAAAARLPEDNERTTNFFPGGYPPPSGMTATITLNVLTSTAVFPEARSFMIDSGASIHLVNDLSLLHSPTLHSSPIPLQMATSDATGQIIATGSLCLCSAEQQPLWLHHVHCVPAATANLISVTAAIKDGACFCFDNVGNFTGMRGPQDWFCPVVQKNGLYFLKKVSPVQNPVHVFVNTIGMRKSHDCRVRSLWHSRLGHPGENNMTRLQSEDLVTGLPVSLTPCQKCPRSCEACIQGKHSRPPFGKRTRAASEPLERIHLDTVGPIFPTAIGGEKYFVTVVDEATHYVLVLGVKTKDAISAAVKELLIFWQRQLDRPVKCIRTDRGSEFFNSTLKGYCGQEGIKFEVSAAYTPQQNGIAERMNRTIKEKARTLLLHAAAQQTLWKEAVETACILYNMGPVCGRSKTPYEAFHGVKPDISLLRTWGCLVHVHIPDQQRGVFEAKTAPGLFTGYSGISKAYRVYMGNGIWRESRDVTFLEHIRGADRVGLSTMTPAAILPPQQSASLPSGQQHGEQSAAQQSFWDLDDPEQPGSVPLQSIASLQSCPIVFLESPASKGISEPAEATTTTSDLLENMSTGMEYPSTEPGRSWSVLEHMENLARGGQEAESQLLRLRDLQSCTKDKREVGGSRGQDGLTRQQRYDQRVAAREAGEAINEGTVSDVSGKEVNRFTESCSPGEVTLEEAAAPDLSSLESMPDHVSAETEAREVTLETPNQTNENHMGPTESQALHACDGHTGESQVCCESVYRVESDPTADGAVFPNYAAPLSDECVWGKINGLGGKLNVAACDSAKERKLQTPAEWEKVREVCNSVTSSGRVAESSIWKGREESHSVHDYNLNHVKGQVPGVRWSKVTVPENLREAQRSPQWEFWLQAMQEEQDSLDAHEVMEYVERPRGHKVIPVHWIFSVKTDAHGNVLRFKARLVAQGCRQIPGVDVDEVFAPTSSYGSRRTLLATAAAKNMEIHQVDIKTAFLNGELEEEVYVTQPPGFENGNPSIVCRLHKALYGLKQAPRAWHKTLNEKLLSMRYEVCKSDAGVYIKRHNDGELSYMLVYVDDLLIVAMGAEEIEWVKRELLASFKIHDLGEVKDFLGCQIQRDRENMCLSLSCIPKIDALCEKFGVSAESRPVDTPMSKDFVMSGVPQMTVGDSSFGSGTPLLPGHRYCELVGSLLYIANTTRPDIAHAVGVLSRYRNTPTTAHMNEGLRVLRYLLSTRECVLVLGGKGPVLEGHVDADYAGDIDSRHSTSGYVLSVFGSAVVWGSKKQHSVATSTVEAEFMAASVAIKEINWLRGFMEEIGTPPWSVKLYCDNQGCIANLKNPLYSKYTKHIAVSFHFAREAIAKGQVIIRYIESAKNKADMLTKPLARPVFQVHRRAFGLVQIG